MLYLPHSLHYFLNIMILCSKMIRSTRSCKNLLTFVQQSDLKKLYQYIIIGQARKYYIFMDFLCFIIFWPPWIIYLFELRSLLYVYGIICSLSSKVWFPQRGACSPPWLAVVADTRYGKLFGQTGSSSYLLSFVAINDRPLYGRRHPYRNLLCTVCSSSSIVGTYSVSDIGYIHQNLGLVIQKSFITCVCINKLFRSPFFEQLF